MKNLKQNLQSIVHHLKEAIKLVGEVKEQVECDPLPETTRMALGALLNEESALLRASQAAQAMTEIEI